MHTYWLLLLYLIQLQLSEEECWQLSCTCLRVFRWIFYVSNLQISIKLTSRHPYIFHEVTDYSKTDVKLRMSTCKFIISAILVCVLFVPPSLLYSTIFLIGFLYLFVLFFYDYKYYNTACTCTCICVTVVVTDYKCSDKQYYLKFLSGEELYVQSSVIWLLGKQGTLYNYYTVEEYIFLKNIYIPFYLVGTKYVLECCRGGR